MTFQQQQGDRGAWMLSSGHQRTLYDYSMEDVSWIGRKRIGIAGGKVGGGGTLGLVWLEVIDGLGAGDHAGLKLCFWKLHLAAVSVDWKRQSWGD